MPRPLYILCSVSGALDSFTNAVSVFGLVESIVGKVAPPGAAIPDPPPAVSMRLTAAWMREPTDAPDMVYESRVGISLGGAELAYASFDPFSFTGHIHRIFVPELKITPTGPGELVFEGKLRRVGETEWVAHQQYRVLVIEEPAPVPEEKPATPASPP